MGLQQQFGASQHSQAAHLLPPAPGLCETSSLGLLALSLATPFSHHPPQDPQSLPGGESIHHRVGQSFGRTHPSFTSLRPEAKSGSTAACLWAEQRFLILILKPRLEFISIYPKSHLATWQRAQNPISHYLEAQALPTPKH